jgi:enoyl-[acyl-carrier protein] reductase I
MLNLKGKRGLVAGIANEHSIAFGCAKVLRDCGAEVGITYGNAKAYPFVEPLLPQLTPAFCLPCDVTNEQEIEQVFTHIKETWGELDFLLHSIAFAPKEAILNRVTDCPKAGFLTAMEVSCYSFIEMCRYADPLMVNGGSLLTLSYYGSEKVVAHYNIMGAVKAALECATRYLAVDFGAKNIRVNAISPGPIMTRAGSGIGHFEELLVKSKEKSPLRSLTTLDDVGNMAAFLVSDLSQNITGGVHYVDGGYGVVD